MVGGYVSQSCVVSFRVLPVSEQGSKATPNRSHAPTLERRRLELGDDVQRTTAKRRVSNSWLSMLSHCRRRRRRRLPLWRQIRWVGGGVNMGSVGKGRRRPPQRGEPDQRGHVSVSTNFGARRWKTLVYVGGLIFRSLTSSLKVGNREWKRVRYCMCQGKSRWTDGLAKSRQEEEA